MVTGAGLTASARPSTSPWLIEGLRLFFPVAACHALLLPLVWIGLFAFSLPFARVIPMSQWHAHEMIFGAYGAALAGFLTSAVPEWTDTRPRRGRSLLLLLFLWLPGRVIGLVGFDALNALAAITDLAFLGVLFWFVLKALIERGSTRHASFAVWVGLFWLVELAIRAAWLGAPYGAIRPVAACRADDLPGVLFARHRPHQCRGHQPRARSER